MAYRRLWSAEMHNAALQLLAEGFSYRVSCERLRREFGVSPAHETLRNWDREARLIPQTIVRTRQRPHVPVPPSTPIRDAALHLFLDEHVFSAAEIAQRLSVTPRFVEKILNSAGRR